MYRPEMCEIAKNMRALGNTDEEIAKELGVSTNTFYTWRREHPDFLRAVSFQDDILINACERAIARRAMGTSLPAMKVTHHLVTHNGAVTDQRVIKTKYREHHLPDANAAFRILEQLAPDRWGKGVDRSAPDKIKSEESAVASLLGMVKGTKQDER